MTITERSGKLYRICSKRVAGAAIEGPADQDDLMWDSLKSEASSGAEVGAGWESASLIAVEHLVSAEHRGRLTVFQDRGVYFHQSKPSYRGPPIFAHQSRVFFTSFFPSSHAAPP